VPRQGGELAESTAVYECYMHVLKPAIGERSPLQCTRVRSDALRSEQHFACLCPLVRYDQRTNAMEEPQIP
jgi:hypothetical protein